MSANDYYGKPQGSGYYPPPQGPPPPGGNYYPQQPPQSYYPPPGGNPGYASQPGPQPIYVQQAPQKDSGGGGCMACLAGMCLCCCAEELCACIF